MIFEMVEDERKPSWDYGNAAGDRCVRVFGKGYEVAGGWIEREVLYEILTSGED